MNKNAIGYVRISNSDQSNFSLDGQEKYITDFCENHHYNLLQIFKDDGKSAKNFDRPDWKLLEIFIKNNPQVSFLVVVKYDRFSRNVSQSLAKIDLLEKKYQIVILSVMEPIALHPQSPYFFQFRMQLLLSAETEWLVIKDRTKFGINQAHSRGRWVNRAPIGYTNTRDDQDKPIIVVDEKRGPIVTEAFNLFINGMPVEELRKWLYGKGIKIAGNSTIQDFLKNPTYCGLILKKAYYDEPEKMITGIHVPLISQDTWYKANAILNSNNGRRHLEYNEAVPLRGSLISESGKLLTAGNSKSGSGKYIWYYVDPITRKHYNADKMHAQFTELLKTMSLPSEHIEYMKLLAIADMKEQLADREQQLEEKEQSLKLLEKKNDTIFEKYIAEELDRNDYTRWKDRYNIEKSTLVMEIAENSKPLAAIWEAQQSSLYLLSDLSFLFDSATIQQKHSFINIVFDRQLTYTGVCYRTNYLLPFFSSKAALLKDKGLLIVNEKSPNKGAFNSKCPEQESNLHTLSNTRF